VLHALETDDLHLPSGLAASAPASGGVARLDARHALHAASGAVAGVAHAVAAHAVLQMPSVHAHASKAASNVFDPSLCSSEQHVMHLARVASAEHTGGASPSPPLDESPLVSPDDSVVLESPTSLPVDESLPVPSPIAVSEPEPPVSPPPLSPPTSLLPPHAASATETNANSPMDDPMRSEVWRIPKASRAPHAFAKRVNRIPYTG
jgi:hypothetical protein